VSAKQVVPFTLDVPLLAILYNDYSGAGGVADKGYLNEAWDDPVPIGKPEEIAFVFKQRFRSLKTALVIHLSLPPSIRNIMPSGQ
jgi:hypothetical protein